MNPSQDLGRFFNARLPLLGRVQVHHEALNHALQ